MYSHWSEYSSHRSQDSDRSSGQWDDCNDRWDGRPQFHSKYQWDSYHKIREDGPSSTERRSRTREFSNSSDRRSSKDSLNRDSGRRSLVRRRGSSPVLDPPVKRRQACAKDKDTDFRYRHKSLEETHNQPKDFKYAPTHVDDFKLRRTSPDLRSGRQRDEVAHRERHDDSSDRSFSDCFSDEDYPKQRWDSSMERTRSSDHFTKKYPNPRERMGSPPTSVHYEDYQNRSSRQSSEGDAAPQSSSVPERKLSAGFQRFLDVLNRGVNVDALAKIVSQTSTEISDEYISQSSLVNTVDHSWLPGCPERRQKPQQHNSSCSGGTRSKLLASPQPHHHSPSPNEMPASDANSPQRGDCRSLSSKITLTPKDEEKRKQMQDVLQAIGMDMGFDELGQMTHRIQERLYGKKNDDRSQKVNQERSTRLSSRHQSRSSSSSGSTFSPSSQDCCETKDECRPPRCLTELQESTEYNWTISSKSFQDSEDRMSNSQEKTAAFKASTPTQTLTQPTLALPPTTSPLLPYPAHFPVLPPCLPPGPSPRFPPEPPPPFSPGLPPPFPPGPPPTLFAPPVRSGAFLPSMLPNPHLCNIFQPSPGQMRHLIPPPTQPFAPPPANVLNIPQNQNEKSTGYGMTRCLLVVKNNQSKKLWITKKKKEKKVKNKTHNDS